MKTPDFKHAEWIWLPHAQFPQYQTAQQTIFAEQKNFCVAVFEKEIVVPKTTTLRVRISADIAYIFKLDGKTLEHGPAEVGGDYGRKEGLPWCFFDEFSLTIPQGMHKIAISVISAPIVMANYSSGKNGLIAEFFDENNNSVLHTDDTWECFVDERYVAGNFTDFSKGNSSKYLGEIKDKALPLPSHLKPLKQTVIKPISVKEKNGLYVFDFGKVYPAYIRMKIQAEEPTIVSFAPQEFEGLTNYGERLLVVKGENVTETLQIHCMRFLEFYFEHPVSIDVELIYTHYPVDTTTYYSCDDTSLNKIFNVSKRTLKICMQKYHLDSPVHQESLGCTGDYFIQSLMNYYTFGETELTKLDILRTAWLLETTNGKMFHTSYSLIWVQWLLDYFHYTGDTAILADCDKALNLLLDRFNSYCENGLLENPPDFMFIDWVLVPPFDLHHPPKNLGQSALNCYYYKSLVCAIEIKRLLNKKDEASILEERAKLLKDTFHKTFWDENKGLYFAGKSDFVRKADFLPISNDERYFILHTNTLAVLYGLAQGNTQEILLKALKDPTVTKAQPYFMHFVFEALYKENLFQSEAFALMKVWEEMLAECDSSLKEIYLPAGFVCDYSHAWGGTLAYQLPSKTLGVKFLHGKPQYIPPVLGPLNHAEGIIPCADGSKLKITVEKINGKITRNIQTIS